MKIVLAKDEVRVCDSAGQPIYRLDPGGRYLMYDDEAARGVREGALEIVGESRSRIPPYRGEPLGAHRVLLPFIGKLGDAVATASCMHALTRRFPDVTVTVSVPLAARRVFELFPDVLDTSEYPPRADQLDRYDYLMSFEDVEAVPGGTGMSLGEVFSRCLHTPQPESPPPIHIPEANLARWRFEDRGSPRVAIHAGPTDSLRSLPTGRTEILASMLVDAGVDVYLVGADAAWAGWSSRSASVNGPLTIAEPRCGTGFQPVKTGVAPASSRCEHGLQARPTLDPQPVNDLINKTPTPADLAAVLMRMHVLVTCDSFPMHLAGAMGVATIALFASTSPALAGDYPSVTALKSSASCSPCGVAEGACPLGQPGCVAMHGREKGSGVVSLG